MKNMVILVDQNDKPLGIMDKMEAHVKGALHRAFSIFIFNSKGEVLLQKRAANKYHSARLWTNTCCSHPMPEEETTVAAHRRLNEEMKLSTDLVPLFKFKYSASFDNNLIEHELDHVYYGISDEMPQPDPAEVEEWKYENIKFLQEDIINNPGLYTEWFKICFDDLVASLPENELKSY